MNEFQFNRVVDYIERNPEKHNQCVWISEVDDDGEACGTTACLAGWTVLLNGWVVSESGWLSSHTEVTKDGKFRRVSNLAAEILEIDEDDADSLFAASNDLEDIKGMAKYILNGEQAEQYFVEKYWANR